MPLEEERQMLWQLLLCGRPTPDGRQGKCRRRAHGLRFEPLEARQIRAGNFGSQAAGDSILDHELALMTTAVNQAAVR
jgi:hypothetical protein